MDALDLSIGSDPEGRATAGVTPRRRALLPFGDAMRTRRLAEIAGWLGGVALAVGVLDRLGADVRGWLPRRVTHDAPPP